jgi:hypothetical protein
MPVVATDSSLKANESEKISGGTSPVTNQLRRANSRVKRAASSDSGRPAALGAAQSMCDSSPPAADALGRKLPRACPVWGVWGGFKGCGWVGGVGAGGAGRGVGRAGRGGAGRGGAGRGGAGRGAAGAAARAHVRQRATGRRQAPPGSRGRCTRSAPARRWAALPPAACPRGRGPPVPNGAARQARRRARWRRRRSGAVLLRAAGPIGRWRCDHWPGAALGPGGPRSTRPASWRKPLIAAGRPPLRADDAEARRMRLEHARAGCGAACGVRRRRRRRP